MISNKKNKNRILFLCLFFISIILLLSIFYFNKKYEKEKYLNREIKIENKYTAIIIEPRKHTALEFVLKNFLLNLSDNWNIIIFHGNQNIDFVNKIIQKSLYKYKNRISLVNLKVDNLTIPEYNKLLVSKEFYNYIPTEVFLVFQTDTIICKDSKNIIDNYIEYDYVGAPWRKNTIKQFININTKPDYSNIDEVLKKMIGNGGLSLRRKSKMLEIIDKCPYNNTIPEDVYFSIPCTSEIKIHKPYYDKASFFSNEQVYTDDSFGIHKLWGPNNFNKYEMSRKNKRCEGLYTLAELNNHKIDESFQNQRNEKCTAIIIETRIHNALPVVLQNFLENLSEEWDIIIFHGTGNNSFINSIIDTSLSSYRHRIQLVNLHIDELTITEYNNILLSKEFYDNIKTEIFLVFQIDSFICKDFKDSIQDYLEYDYVGSPWKHSYTEKLIENSDYTENNVSKNKYFEYNEPSNEINKRLIGSGGLSLRRKSKMLEILNSCSKNTKVPEDIYFSIPCNSIQINKPSYNKGLEFSMESVYSNKSFGINKPWLYFNDDEIFKKNETCPGIKDLYNLNNQYKNNHIDIIVARYNEDLEWMNEIPFSNYKYIIYNKGDNDNFEKRYSKKIINLPNVGKCDHTYLHHIIHNYDNLAEINVFLPGSLDLWYKKKIALSLMYEIEKNNKAVFISLNVKDVKNEFYDFTIDEYKTAYPKNLKKNSESIIQKSIIRPFGLWFQHFFGNVKVDTVIFYGIFSVHKDDILQHNKSRYETIINQLMTSNPEVGHYVERNWGNLVGPMKNTLIIKYNSI